MRKSFLTLSLLFLILSYSQAQIHFEPIIGYQLDLNNHPRLNQLNTSFQFAFKTKKSELLLTVQKSWGFARFSSDSSFTINPSLPLYSPAQKKTSPGIFSFLISRRWTIIGNQASQHINLLASIGVSHQAIKVNYDYDKADYTILNPDKTIATTGMEMELGLEYMLPVENGRWFAQLKVGGMTVFHKKDDYPNSFYYSAPLSLNLGYSFQIKKRHEKK